MLPVEATGKREREKFTFHYGDIWRISFVKLRFLFLFFFSKMGAILTLCIEG
jgi:hypothetical protein